MITSNLLNIFSNTVTLNFQNPLVVGEPQDRATTLAADTYVGTNQPPPQADVEDECIQPPSQSLPPRLTEGEFRNLIRNLNSNDASVRANAFSTVEEQFPNLISDLDSGNFPVRQSSIRRFEELFRNCPVENLETFIRSLKDTRRTAPSLECARRIDNLLRPEFFQTYLADNSIRRRMEYANVLFNTGIFNLSNIQTFVDNLDSNELRARAVESFAQNTNTSMRRFVVDSSYVLSGVLDRLSRDPEPSVRASVARRRDINSQALHILLQDQDENVREAAINAVRLRLEANSLDILPETLDRLVGPSQNARISLEESRDILDARIALARYRYTSPELLRILLRAPSVYGQPSELRVALARNPNTPRDALLSLANSCQYYSGWSMSVGLALLGRSSLPSDVLRSLAISSSGDVRNAVIRRPGTTGDILDIMVRDPLSSYTNTLEVISHPNIMSETLDYIYENSAESVREAVMNAYINQTRRDCLGR